VDAGLAEADDRVRAPGDDTHRNRLATCRRVEGGDPEGLEPCRGRVYDPCCGSSGMFVQSMEFIRAHANGNGNGGKARADISSTGRNRTTPPGGWPR
jgi:hypothetical protein